MSQARYGAESGVQVAVNYLLNTYAPPGTNPADPIANVQHGGLAGHLDGLPVVLSSDTTAVASNYPVPAVQAAFLAAAGGSLPAGMTTVVVPRRTRRSSRCSRSTPTAAASQTIQTWQITSTGTITASRTAVVEVTATLEAQKLPATLYAAFGTSGGCGAITFSGYRARDSYSSSAALASGLPVIAQSGGNVGTNGNLTVTGSADVYGNLSTPRVGVGACSAGNVDALTASGGAHVNGSVVQLPQAVTLSSPTVPTGVPTTAYNGNGQTLLNGASVGNVTVTTGTLTLCAPGLTCTINVNSIKFTGNGTIVVATGATVVLNVVGSGDTTPIDLVGGTTVNASFDPSHLQILYAGTGTVKLGGNSNSSEMVYAPNAAVETSGTGDVYGSIVASTINVSGTGAIHYDRNLSSTFFIGRQRDDELVQLEEILRWPITWCVPPAGPASRPDAAIACAVSRIYPRPARPWRRQSSCRSAGRAGSRRSRRRRLERGPGAARRHLADQP